MKILITGSNGLLGQKLTDYCLRNSIDFISTSKGKNRYSKCPDERYMEMDITNEEEVMKVVSENSPTHIIHTAAMTNVDACENEPDQCELINVQSVEFLLKASQKNSCHFQLLSTDFIFDGEKGNYSEEDKPNPLSVYGMSKWKAEQLLLKYPDVETSAVRTIIVYGRGENLTRNNIILWAKSALEKGDPLNIIDDQFRAPTYADDLAQGCMLIVEKGKSGIFNICGPEILSIYEIVERIANYFDYSTKSLNKISSKTLNQAAHRPPKTGLNLTKSRSELGYDPHTLEQTLDLLFQGD